MANVRVERQDEVTTVILDRGEVRNAVDNATAEELAEFEAATACTEEIDEELWR